MVPNANELVHITKKVIFIPILFLLVPKDGNIVKWFMFGLANLAFLFTFCLGLDAIIRSA